MAQELRLTLLGGTQITHGDAPLTGFVSSKVQALLCYLAVTGRPHTRAELAGLLWGDMSESLALTNLRTALHNLHDLVGPHLMKTRQEVEFNRAEPYWLDVELFQAWLQAGSANQDLERWGQAAALYQGDFLQGFYVHDAPSFEEWMLQKRQELRELALGALGQLAAYHAARHNYALGLDYTRRLLSVEPWREEAHQQLMTLLARTGRRGAALAQYDLCRRRLQEEFGLEPMPQTKALYERIRNGDLVANNLPPASGPIVGRESELGVIARRLDQPDCRLMALVGLSGVGKTRLALAAAQAQLKSFPDGVYWVPLAPLRSANFLVPTIAEALGLVLYGGEDPENQLLNYLSEKCLLLVLDGFEHVLDGVDVVAAILARAPGVKTLVTSTERLGLQGEWLLPVGGLSVPPSQPEQALEAYSAVQLFLQRARQSGRPPPLGEADRRCVARICQLVDGLPLAIELAAAWVGAMPCCQIAAEIEHSLDFLAASFRDLPERHRSMRAVFDYTWHLLLPAEREVFSRLAVFRRGFEAAAAEQVASAPLTALSALVDKSLLAFDGERYQVHDLLRQYAREKLVHSGLEAQVRDRHLDYYLDLVRQADPKLHGPEQVVWLDRLESEHDNLRTALEWALKGARADASVPSGAALNLAGSLGLFWDLRGHFGEGRAWLDRALDLPPPAPPDPQWKADRTQALYWAGHLAKWQGNYRRAAELAEANLTLCRELGDPWRIAYALYLSGSIANKQGDLERARAFLDESLSLFRAVNARWGLAHTLGTLGNIARSQGRYDEALARWNESYEIYRDLGDRRGLARTLNRLWHLPFRQGDYARATALLEEAATLFRELSHRDGVAIILRHLGLVSQAEGNAARARTLYEQSRSIFQELGDNDDLAYATWYLGRLELEEGRLPVARTLLEKSRALAQEAGDKGLVAQVSQSLASVELALRSA